MDECPICLLNLEGSVVQMGCCNQKMHLECVVQCLNLNMQCPMCRGSYSGVTTTHTDDQVVVVSQKRDLFKRIFIFTCICSVVTLTISWYV